MSIDEAIKHCEEVAEEKESICNVIENKGETWTDSGKNYYDICKKCASEHRQLAEWLRELKAYRGILANADRLIESEYGVVIIEGYKDVIDQMNEVYMEVNADEDID